MPPVCPRRSGGLPWGLGESYLTSDESAGRFSAFGPVGTENLRQQYAGDVSAHLNVTDDKCSAVTPPLPKLINGDVAAFGRERHIA
jgi:hypothetical protein